MEQGRLASCHMFGQPSQMIPNLIPYGIYTIPEVSMVGQTEQQLTQAKDTVFNYPTLAEAYKVAALDGLNKL